MIVICQSGISKDLNDDQIRKLAWNAFDESEKNGIVGSKEDILHENKNNFGVTTIINNAPVDVWREAETEYLNENQIKGVTQRLKVKNVSNKIAKVSFKTLVGESSGIPYVPIRIYIDAKKGIMIGRENGYLYGEMQF